MKKNPVECPGYTMRREIFRENLDRLIIDRDVSARQVSKNIGRTATYINKLQNGNISPTFEILCVLADYFKVPIEYFLYENRK